MLFHFLYVAHLISVIQAAPTSEDNGLGIGTTDDPEASGFLISESDDSSKNVISPNNHHYQAGYHYKLPDRFKCDVLCLYPGPDTFFICNHDYCLLGELGEDQVSHRHQVCEAGKFMGQCLFVSDGIQDSDDPAQHTQGMSNQIGPNNHNYLPGYIYTPPDGYKCDKLCLLKAEDSVFICRPDYCVVGEQEWDYDNNRYFPQVCEAGKPDGVCLDNPPDQ